jgi:tRNA modification GTPase
MPFLLIDTAGLRESEDEVESIGVDRARESLERADLVLWLGDSQEAPDTARTIIVRSKADLAETPSSPEAEVRVSALTGEGVDRLVFRMVERARALLPAEGEVSVNARHRAALAAACGFLCEAAGSHDMLLAAEGLRQARLELDRVTGRAGVEDMLDALFGRFCIGK